MTRREAVASAAGIFVVALLVRIVFASQIVFPKPEDTAYYVGVARNLVEGRGLVSDALWSYQTPPLEFPRQAFEVWLPLPSLLAAIPMALLGATFAAAQWSSVVLGAIVPVLAWRLAADVAAERGLPTGRARTLAIGTGLTCAVYLPLVLHSALPDSTMPFAVLALSACLLMARIARDPRGGRLLDPRLIGLGVLIGLAALTRNEAVYIGLAWLIVVAGIAGLDRRARAGLVVAVAGVAVLVFLPWAIRDWLTFGSPLPGQAVANAFSVTGTDIFAWNDPPTLSRYLAVGPARLVEMRVVGLAHNLFSVLLLPGLPVSLIGFIGLPWAIRGAAIRPLVIVSVAAFVVTSLVFPVATTWGTFLHAAGPVQVLLVISAMLALDALIARVEPPAWLDPAGRLARGTARRLRLAALLGRPAPVVRHGVEHHGRAVPRARGRHGRGRPSARWVIRPGHHQLPDLAGRVAADRRAGTPRRAAARRPRPGLDLRREAGRPDRRRQRALAGRSRCRGRRGVLLP